MAKPKPPKAPRRAAPKRPYSAPPSLFEDPPAASPTVEEPPVPPPDPDSSADANPSGDSPPRSDSTPFDMPPKDLPGREAPVAAEAAPAQASADAAAPPPPPSSDAGPPPEAPKASGSSDEGPSDEPRPKKSRKKSEEEDDFMRSVAAGYAKSINHLDKEFARIMLDGRIEPEDLAYLLAGRDLDPDILNMLTHNIKVWLEAHPEIAGSNPMMIGTLVSFYGPRIGETIKLYVESRDVDKKELAGIKQRRLEWLRKELERGERELHVNDVRVTSARTGS